MASAVPPQEGRATPETSCATNKLREGFVGLAEALLSSISDVFPECENTARVLALFRTLIKGDAMIEDVFVRKCHALFKQNSDALKRREAEALFIIVESLDYVRDIDLRNKWEDPDFSDETVNARFVAGTAAISGGTV